MGDQADTGDSGVKASYVSAVATAALCGLAIRVGYAVGWRWDRGLLYDGPVYRNRAASLLAGRSFLDPDAWFFHSRISEGAVHPPGNTLWLALADLPDVGPSATVSGDRLAVETTEVTVALNRLTSWALDRGIGLADLTVSRPSLEDVYLALTDDVDDDRHLATITASAADPTEEVAR